MASTAPCLRVTPDDAMFQQVRQEMAAGKYFFVRLDRLSERVTEADATELDNLDRIDSAFLATHAMIEKAALLQRDKTTYWVQTNTMGSTCAYPGTLENSIQWLNIRTKDARSSDETTQIFKIIAFKERVSPRSS